MHILNCYRLNKKENIPTMKKKLLTVVALGIAITLQAQQIQYETRQNIHYYVDSINKSDTYINERCVLDIYFPKDVKGFATVYWFHGGGMERGSKVIPEALKEHGIAVVAVNYRLSPKVKSPKYIEDAAAAVSWGFKNITDFGGDTSLIFVSGASAGAYLISMIGLDKSWLGAHNIDANRIAGLIPITGETITSAVIRKERGIPDTQPVIDHLAPLYHVRPDAPPLLLITGDRELEFIGRYEENAYLMRMMRVVGHKETKLYELGGFSHNKSLAEAAFPLLLNEIQRITEEKNNKR